MKHTVLIYLFLILLVQGFAQTGKISGSVVDAQNKSPLELATVSILKPDSSLISYQLSDKSGKFTFTKLPLKQQLLINVSYTGYGSYFSVIKLESDKPDTLLIQLGIDTKDTVVVTAKTPVRMNGDTLEINPAAFTMKEDAVVEELLNQVSGMVIWSDGSITMNGKKIQTLLVDGKPFMGANDSRVATQNLPKSAIDKIQLYQEYDRSKINEPVGQPQDSLLTMNIKLKENSKKGFFGKAGAGYGTTDRFESDLSLQTYTKKTTAGIGGGFNNINKPIGNIQDMFQNNTYRNFNPNLYNVGRFGASGINKNHAIGALFTHNFIDAGNSRQNNRIAMNYTRSGTDGYLTDLSLQTRTTIDNPQFIREEGVQNSLSNRNDFSVNYVKTNSYNDNLNVSGSVNTSKEDGNTSRFTEVRDSTDRLQSTNQSNTVYNRRTDNQAINGSFAKNLTDDPLKSFTIQFNGRSGNNSSERFVNSRFQSFTDPAKNTSYNRLYTTDGHSVNLSGNLDYVGFKRLLFGRYNFFGINLNLNQALNYSKNTDNSLVSDYDSTSKTYVTNTKISNRNEREIFEYTPSLRLSKSFNKYSNRNYRTINLQTRFIEDIKTDKNSSASFAKRNLNRSFQFFRQDATLSHNYSRQEKFQTYSSLSYSKNYEYPSIDQLYTIVDDINVYDTRIGNPNLKNRTNHSLNVNGNFNTQNPKSVYSFNGNLSGSYTRTVDPITDSVINDPSGKRIYYYTNADRSTNTNLNYSFNVSRRFKKNNVQLMYNGQFRTGKQPNYIDGFYNISETGNLSNQFTVQLSLGSLLIFNATRNMQQSESKQTAAGLKGFKNSTNSNRVGIVVNYPSDFSFSSTVEQIDNSNLNKPTMLWNAFATYRFMKGQAEVKASAMDILKQYRNISNTVNSYGTTTRVTNGLQQFYLITLSYYPRKFGKKEAKGRPVNVRNRR